MEQWHVDSLDPLAGSAFASYRGPDLEADKANANLPAVFVTAPNFQPFPLTNRSVGLAAARGTFQSGFIIAGSEVGFLDLDDVIEFVRRCYVGGGGGVGGGPSGGPAPVPDGGPELPPGPTFEMPTEIDSGELIAVARNDLQTFSKNSGSMKSSPTAYAFTMTWSQPPSSSLRKPHSGSVKGQTATSALTRAAIRLLHELIRRFPARGTSRELAEWLASYWRLHRTIQRMGLARFVQDPLAEGQLQQLFTAISEHASASQGEAFAELFEHREFGRKLLFRWDRRPVLDDQSDPLDDLHSWPLPTPLQKAIGSAANNNNPSMLNFLAAFLASPASFASTEGTEIELALFAAARIVASSDTVSTDLQLLSHLYVPEPAAEDIFRKFTDASWSWLTRQMPRKGFGPDIEEAIFSTSALLVA